MHLKSMVNASTVIKVGVFLVLMSAWKRCGKHDTESNRWHVMCTTDTWTVEM